MRRWCFSGLLAAIVTLGMCGACALLCLVLSSVGKYDSFTGEKASFNQLLRFQPAPPSSHRPNKCSQVISTTHSDENEPSGWANVVRSVPWFALVASALAATGFIIIWQAFDSIFQILQVSGYLSWGRSLFS